MVVAYLEGRQAAKWLGCEQGAVLEWDDIVQELSDGSLLHTQVKRQAKDFSTEKSKREAKPVRPTKGKTTAAALTPAKLPDLSAFDKSIAALAEWFSPEVVRHGKVRAFTAQLPDRKVQIKHEFDVRNFEEFCTLCNNKTTTPQGLVEHAQKNASSRHIYDWLTTWCGFSDWEHIHDAMRNLRVEVRSLEQEIEQTAESALDKYFFPASEAFKALLYDLEYGATDAGAATPRQVLALISKFLRPEFPIWTQYALEETSFTWGISGCATGHTKGIEDPTQTVPIYWTDGTLTEKRLKVCVKFDHQTLSREPLAPRLIRLALHLRGLSRASISEMRPWSVAIKGVLANTLGVTSDDFAALPWVEARDISYCVDSRHLPGVVDANLECENFDSAMGRVVWSLTKAGVSSDIRNLLTGDLQVAVDELWRTIFALLDSDLAQANALLAGMLSPASEKLGMLGVMRVGPKTVEILVPGLMMLMITAVALKRHTDVAALLSGKDIRVIALRYWGGPASSNRSARILVDQDDDSEVEDFLGKEVANIVLMSEARSSHSEVNRFSIAADRSSQDSFSASRRARLAVTNSRQFQAAVRSGKIEAVANLLASELRLRDIAREENIMKTELTT